MFDDLPGAFAAMVEWQADGLITLNDAMLFSQRGLVVTLALNKQTCRRAPGGGVRGGGWPCLLWCKLG